MEWEEWEFTEEAIKSLGDTHHGGRDSRVILTRLGAGSRYKIGLSFVPDPGTGGFLHPRDERTVYFNPGGPHWKSRDRKVFLLWRQEHPCG